MTAGARAKRAEASVDLEYSISTVKRTTADVVWNEKKTGQGRKGEINLIAAPQSHHTFPTYHTGTTLTF